MFACYMKQITSFLCGWHTSDMLSCTSVFLVHVSCTKQNAVLFRASLYKNLYELESNSDFVQETQVSCTCLLFMFLECVSGILLTGF